VKITIVYDNEVWEEGLEADWGFSCLVEADNSPRILFDTGGRGSMPWDTPRFTLRCLLQISMVKRLSTLFG
jgi:hypothetical protein